MPAVLSTSEPIPAMADEPTTSYKEIIRQIASQAPKPYGDIPPLLKKRKKKSRQHHLHHHRESPTGSNETGEAVNLSSPSPLLPLPPLPAMQQQAGQRRKPMRRMSHVEDWIEIDSKESLPDEEELVRPFSDFFTQVLPLHSPPPSLSDPTREEDDLQTLDDEDEDGYGHQGRNRRRGSVVVVHGWKSDGEEEDDDRGLAIPSSAAAAAATAATTAARTLVRRHSISSFSKAGHPVTSTSASHATSTSPPREDIRWAQTMAKLRRSLRSPKNPPQGFIPMPPAPRRPTSHRRRSEATTQPRFNPDTNTYTRDTRSNPDHLRIIACELNMIRTRKLLSPLKPRGFLPRRKDPFVRGQHRRVSDLQYEWSP